jgi:hypothetical protein
MIDELAVSLRVPHPPVAADPAWMKIVIARSASDVAISRPHKWLFSC